MQVSGACHQGDCEQGRRTRVGAGSHCALWGLWSPPPGGTTPGEGRRSRAVSTREAHAGACTAVFQVRHTLKPR